jgi:hypothetical protein
MLHELVAQVGDEIGVFVAPSTVVPPIEPSDAAVVVVVDVVVVVVVVFFFWEPVAPITAAGKAPAISATATIKIRFIPSIEHDRPAASSVSLG